MELTFTRGQKWRWIKFEASCELIFAYFSKNFSESIDPYVTSWFIVTLLKARE